MSICSSRGYSSSQRIQNLRKEIHQIDSMLKENEEKQNQLVTFIQQSREKRSIKSNIHCSSHSSTSFSSSMLSMHSNDDSHQTLHYNNNAYRDCSSCAIKHNFQCVSFSNSTHPFTSLPSMTSTSINEDYSLPIVMQGHISNQPVTLLNRSAAQLILQLKSLHFKQDILKESFENLRHLVATREQQLCQMTRTLNDCNQQMKTVEQLKTIENILFNQQWKDIHSKIHRFRADARWMSEFIQPDETLKKTILEKINKISHPVEPLKKETTHKDKEKKKHKESTKMK